MRIIPDMTGQRFGTLIVARRAANIGTAAAWECACDCGRVQTFHGSTLRNNGAVRCTECRRATRAWRNTKHGKSHTLEYKTWTSMKTRCTNPNEPNWMDYGGRGILVCDRWMRSFEAFLSDIGTKARGQSIDRIDVNGNYEPGNCRWATSKEQARNTRRTVLNIYLVNEIRGRFEHGESARSISKRLGIRSSTISLVVRNKQWVCDECPGTAA